MNAHSRRSSLAGAFAVIALLAGACGTTADEPEETVTVTTTSTSATSKSPTTTTSAEPEPEPEPSQLTTASPVAPAPAPNAAQQAPPPPPPQAAGPQIGDFCIGADIGRRGVDAAGTAIVCDNYEWRPDVGQRPSHPWVDGQIAWAECTAEFTDEECREMLNG